MINTAGVLFAVSSLPAGLLAASLVMAVWRVTVSVIVLAMSSMVALVVLIVCNRLRGADKPQNGRNQCGESR